MLCEKCLNLFKNGPEVEEFAEPALSEYLNDAVFSDDPPLSRENDHPWRIHHAQDVDIYRSIEEGCVICTAIWEHIDTYFLSRNENWSQPFVLQRPQPDAQEAIVAHGVIVWSFLISWKGGRSKSTIDFYLIPCRFQVFRNSHSLTR